MNPSCDHNDRFGSFELGELLVDEDVGVSDVLHPIFGLMRGNGNHVDIPALEGFHQQMLLKIDIQTPFVLLFQLSYIGLALQVGVGVGIGELNFVGPAVKQILETEDQLVIGVDGQTLDFVLDAFPLAPVEAIDWPVFLGIPELNKLSNYQSP